METKSTVFKRKSGKGKGKWIARVEYYDSILGKTRSIERTKDRRTDAIDERDRLVNEIKKSHGQIRTGERMTFSQLADISAERFFQKAVIVEGRKIEGVRSYRPIQTYIAVLKEFFGKRRIGQITVESLKEYKRWRLKQGSRRKEAIESEKFVPVKLASINRELAALRRMMRYAHAEGWVTRDIFFKAGVIDVSAEMERSRMLTEAEEVRLLAACQGERSTTYTRHHYGKEREVTASVSVDNPHLKALVLIAVDAGLRRGEILKLRWDDIDFDANLIHVLGTNTKTERERYAPLTERAKAELVRVREFTQGDMPFDFSDFKRSWATAKRIAGINDLHFHDLRRTFLTRSQAKFDVSLAVAGKLAGHTNLQTTMRYYTATDIETIRDLTEKMNAAHAEAVPETTATSEFVN